MPPTQQPLAVLAKLRVEDAKGRKRSERAWVFEMGSPR